MQILLLCMGKTDEKELLFLIDKYKKRVQQSIQFEIIEGLDIKNRKNLSEIQQKEKETLWFEKNLKTGDFIILLDEKGKVFNSKVFAQNLQSIFNQSHKRIVFIIGGPYGFSEKMYELSHQKISLSALTFTHQMVRLFLCEQIYRTFTILENKPYHHE
ncbi:MAG: 23S rRNA (pseudouridine(1915)-N(3))-methyltransferase RlmH [Flavobacteriaceae bacterium]|nr:MAG: 23S rRNA (pseudouridine(1915)-N(3))-methyltransferase RlmH [Flavobacteriaceae bacterium]